MKTFSLGLMVIATGMSCGLLTFAEASARQSLSAVGSVMAGQIGSQSAGAASAKPNAPSAEMLASGKHTFSQYCSACHGPKGQGGPAPEGGKPARDLTQGAFQDSKTDAQLFAIVHDGVAPDFFMEAWGDRMSETEIRSVVTYLRTLRAPPKTASGSK